MAEKWRPGSHSRQWERLCCAAAVICGLTMLFSCRDHSTRWDGQIENINGVVVVRNPIEPIVPNAILTLKEDLSIGREDAGEQYLFSDITGLAVSDEGSVYVINRPDANVRVFDRNGLFLNTIGRKGQGPGEMEMPIYVQIGAGRCIFIFDYSAHRGLYFSRDGGFLRQQPSLGTFLPVWMNSKGKIIGMEVLAPPPLGGKVYRAYSSDLRALFEIAKEEQGSKNVFDIGKPACYCAVKPDDSIVWGDSKEYVLHVLDADGRQIRRITKPYDPVPISSLDRESINQRNADAVPYGMKVKFRSHYPAFGGIFADDAGRIFVKTYERFESVKHAYFYDIFDPDGRFYAKVPIRATLDRLSVWKNGNLYTHEMDPEGYPVIKRYEVIWDNEMR
jgi:DNA-binding beta-propeller fold protein YncE